MRPSITIPKFGLLDFTQLEEIFDVRIFGLSESDTENTLDSLRNEWRSMSESCRRDIVNEYLYEEHS